MPNNFWGALAGSATGSNVSGGSNNLANLATGNWANVSLGAGITMVGIDMAQTTSSTVAYTYQYTYSNAHQQAMASYMNQGICHGFYNQTLGGNAVISSAIYSPTIQTPEEIAAQAAAHEKYVQKVKAAESRAESLLLCCLTAEQERQYRELGYFETEISDKVYRIKKGRSGNVYLIDGGKEKYKYCAHPDKWMPDQDVMLSQLLMLKTNEAQFLKTANRTVLHVAG